MALPKVIPKPIFQAIAGLWLAGCVGLTVASGVLGTWPYAPIAAAMAEGDGTYDPVAAGAVTFLVPFALTFPLVLGLRLFADMPTVKQSLAAPGALFSSLPAASVDAFLAGRTLAPPGRRVAAFAIDRALGVVFVLLGCLPAVGLQALVGDGAVALVVIAILVGLVPGIAYLWLRDMVGGRSLARRLLGMQVIDVATGAPIGAKAAFLREIAVHVAPLLGIELLLLFQRADHRRLGDQWAKTVVVMRPGLSSRAMIAPDDARAPRSGEELDADALGAFLAAKLGDAYRTLTVRQFPSGHSNLTYLIQGGPNELVLRRPPFGAEALAKGGHDMLREARVLERLHPVYPKAPEPVLAVAAEESPFSAPFYVMKRARGVVLRASTKDASLDAPTMRSIHEGTIDALAELHRVDVNAAGLGDLGKPEGYVQRQVSGWTARYEKARTDDIAAMDAIARFLAEHQPAELGPTILHNDWKLDNVVLDPADLARIVAVLDWEMATIGDPRSDLGTTLAYWIDAADPPEMQMLHLGLPVLPGALSRREAVLRYEEKTSREVTDPVFFYALGCFKVAVIAQQIYFRYAKGFTKDERFARMIMGVHILAGAASRAIASGRIGA